MMPDERRGDNRRRCQNTDRRSYRDACPRAVLGGLVVHLDLDLAIGVLGHQRNVRGAREPRRMQFKKRVVVRLDTSTVSVGSGVDENRPVAHLISGSGLGVF